jgi:hypothetical protein
VENEVQEWSDVSPHRTRPGVSLDRDKLARYHELSKRQEMGAWIEDPRKPGAVTMQPKW